MFKEQNFFSQLKIEFTRTSAKEHMKECNKAVSHLLFFYFFLAEVEYYAITEYK